MEQTPDTIVDAIPGMILVTERSPCPGTPTHKRTAHASRRLKHAMSHASLYRTLAVAENETQQVRTEEGNSRGTGPCSLW